MIQSYFQEPQPREINALERHSLPRLESRRTTVIIEVEDRRAHPIIISQYSHLFISRLPFPWVSSAALSAFQSHPLVVGFWLRLSIHSAKIVIPASFLCYDMRYVQSNTMTVVKWALYIWLWDSDTQQQTIMNCKLEQVILAIQIGLIQYLRIPVPEDQRKSVVGWLLMCGTVVRSY